MGRTTSFLAGQLAGAVGEQTRRNSLCPALPAATKVRVLGVYVEDPPNIGVAVQVVLAPGAEAAAAAFGRKLR